MTECANVTSGTIEGFIRDTSDISAATLYRKEGGEADDKEIERGESHLVGDVET